MLGRISVDFAGTGVEKSASGVARQVKKVQDTKNRALKRLDRVRLVDDCRILQEPGSEWELPGMPDCRFHPLPDRWADEYRAKRNRSSAIHGETMPMVTLSNRWRMLSLDPVNRLSTQITSCP